MHPDPAKTPTSDTAFISTPEFVNIAVEWLTPREAAGRIRVSVETIYDACALQRLTHVRLAGCRSIRIKPEWLDEWMTQHTVERH
jgi:excisionase family DNA binding protein